MGIPLVQEVSIPGEAGELEALRRILGRVDIEGVVVGAIASDYQHDRVNRIADEMGIRVFAPLWRHAPRRLGRDSLAAGLDIAFSSVSAEGLDAGWLGRRWDEAVIADLLRLQETRGIHPCGEGGEFETLVLDGPVFRRRVEIIRAETEWRGTSGVWRGQGRAAAGQKLKAHSPRGGGGPRKQCGKKTGAPLSRTTTPPRRGRSRTAH